MYGINNCSVEQIIWKILILLLTWYWSLIKILGTFTNLKILKKEKRKRNIIETNDLLEFILMGISW